MVAGTVAACLLLPSLRKDIRIEKVFPDRDPRRQDYRAFKDVFGQDDVVAFVALEQPRPALEQASLARVHSLTALLAEHPLVDPGRLATLSRAPVARTSGEELIEIAPLYVPARAAGWDPAEAEALLQGNPSFEDRLISRDRRLAGFLIPLAPNQLDGERSGDVVRREFAEFLLEFFSPEGQLQDGEQAWLEGFAITNYRVLSLLNKDIARFYPLAFGLIFVALGVVFRRFLPTFVAMAVMAICCLWTVGAMALLGIPFSFMSSAIPVMVLVVCVGDCVHLIAHYQRELAAGASNEAALTTAVEEVGRACFFTSVTTAAGFGALSLSQIEIVRELGIPVALGVLIAYVVTFCLLPPLLRWLPPRPGKARAPFADPLRRLADGVARRPGRVAGVTLLAVAAALATLPWLSRETRLLQAFDERSPLMQTRHFFEERLGGVAPLEVYVDTGKPGGAYDPAVQRGLLALAEELRGEAFREQGVLSVLSLADFLADAWFVLEARDPAARGTLPDSPEGLAELHLLYWMSGEDPSAAYVDGVEDPQRLRLQLRVRNSYTSEFFALVGAVDAAARRHLPESATVRVTGMTLMSQAIHSSLSTELAQSLGLALLSVGLLVLVFFRSPRLALLGLIPNLLPLVFVLALMVLTGTALSLSTSIVFSIVFGISVDDTIHFVAALAERERRGEADAISATIRGTGASLVLSSLVLVVGFSVLLISNFPTNRTFGALVAATVVFALVGDLLLLPALLHLRARMRRT